MSTINFVMFFRKAMKLNCQHFLLIFLLLQTVLTQEEGKAISSGFKQSIDKFIEKIAVLKKNMKKLAAEREKANSKSKPSESDDINEYEMKMNNLTLVMKMNHMTLIMKMKHMILMTMIILIWELMMTLI